MPDIEKETVKLYSKIEKYANEGNTSLMSDVLTALKKQPMTVDVLRETKVGIKINKLRQKIDDKEIKQQIKNLIKQWKNVANNENSDQNSHKEEPKAAIQQSGSVPLQLTGDPHRDKRRELISKALKAHFEEYRHARCQDCAEQIETALNDEYGSNPKKLKLQFMSKLSNLKDPKNPSLRASVMDALVKASELVKMTPSDMASDELKNKIKEFEKENLRECQEAVNQGTETDMFTCGKCKKKRCTYTQLQTRSSDEPMTTFVFCMNCGNRWKFC